MGKTSGIEGAASVPAVIFLVDHNLRGHARILLGSIASQGWLDSAPIRFVTFKEMGLSIDSNDRVVWRLAQENQIHNRQWLQSLDKTVLPKIGETLFLALCLSDRSLELSLQSPALLQQSLSQASKVIFYTVESRSGVAMRLYYLIRASECLDTGD